MLCISCGAKIEEGMRFCPKCGTKIVKETAGKQKVGRNKVSATFFVTGNYLESAPELVKQMVEDGLPHFFWSLAYVDWYRDKQPTKEEAFKKLVGRIHSGAIVLLHSTSKTNSEILDELLTRWEEMGYTFRTLEDFVE